jgi:hypothetical protein
MLFLKATGIRCISVSGIQYFMLSLRDDCRISGGLTRLVSLTDMSSAWAVSDDSNIRLASIRRFDFSLVR